MTGLKAGMAAAGAAAMIAFGGGTAWACEGPQVALGPASAGPGDEVSFELSCTEPGDAFRVSVEGQEVASGTDDGDAGVASSFTMPDLGGSERSVRVVAAVTRGEGEPATSGAELLYRPRAAPPDPAPQPVTPAAAPAGTAAAGIPAAPSPSAEVSAGSPSGAPPAPSSRSRRTAVRGSTFVPRAGRRQQAQARKTRRATKRRKKARKRRRQRAHAPLSQEDRRKPPVTPTAETKDELLPLRFPFHIAWRLIAGVALGGVLMLTLLRAIVLLARRRRTDAGDTDLDQLEAELQEFLAAESVLDDEPERLLR